jgi:hypothetical protein
MRCVKGQCPDAAAVRPDDDAGNLQLRFSFSQLAFGDFLAIDGDITGCLDADPNLRAVHCHHGDFDILADAQCLPGAAGEYQHEMAPSEGTLHYRMPQSASLWAFFRDLCRTSLT